MPPSSICRNKGREEALKQFIKKILMTHGKSVCWNVLKFWFCNPLVVKTFLISVCTVMDLVNKSQCENRKINPMSKKEKKSNEIKTENDREMKRIKSIFISHRPSLLPFLWASSDRGRLRCLANRRKGHAILHFNDVSLTASLSVHIL